MLQRVLEPEVMDSPEEALDYDSMDHSEVNRAFVSDLLASHAVARDVLDLGTGTAQIPIELCRQNDAVRVMAVDASVSMLDVARANLEVAGLTDRIQLDRVDAKQLPYADGRFACVMSNSIVHHLADPQPALAEALRVAAPGGWIFFRDLARPQDEAELARLVETYAGDANDHQRRMFADSLRAALTCEEMRDLAGRLGAAPQGVQMTSDRHWTWNCRVEESAKRHG